MTELKAMFHGNYGKKALTRHSKWCDKREVDPGCLDGWVWFQDWEEWQAIQQPEPGTAGNKKKKKKKKKSPRKTKNGRRSRSRNLREGSTWR